MVTRSGYKPFLLKIPINIRYFQNTHIQNFLSNSYRHLQYYNSEATS